MGSWRGKHLLCRVGVHLCALSVDDVEETMRPLSLDPVDGAPDLVAGLSIVRGVPIAVVDLRVLLGASSGDAPRRWVVVTIGERRAALAVDAVLGVRELPASSELPPLSGAIAADRIAAIGMLDGALLYMLRSARLLPEQVWAATEGAR